MTNDNENPSNVVQFKKKQITQGPDLMASVFVNNGLIGISIKEGLIFLTPEAAFQMCLVLASAIKAIKSPDKDI
jgi:hypothetical protein